VKVKVSFLAPARLELQEAIRYYELVSPGLGHTFKHEVQRTLQRVKEFPSAWTPLSESIRRCQTRRFPYAILYQIDGNEIIVVAVMHLHRDPKEWRDRLEP
jgi:plasmid stabilization system protein ParE